jgi:ATP-binding cassette subfamily B protein
MPTVADPTGQKFHRAWGTRLQSLKNIPPVLKIIWDSSPAVVTWGLVLRAIAALSPLALLAVAKLIIDAVVTHLTHAASLRSDFWWLVALEFGLACLTSILNRIVDYCDTLLADKFIRHISVRIMHHEIGRAHV